MVPCDGEHLIITVNHDGDSDGAGGEAPRILPHQRLAALLRLELDAEHLAKVLSQAVTATQHSASL